MLVGDAVAPNLAYKSDDRIDLTDAPENAHLPEMVWSLSTTQDTDSYDVSHFNVSVLL